MHIIKGLLKGVIGLGVVILIVAYMSGFFAEKVSAYPEHQPLARQTWTGETATVQAREVTVYEHAAGSFQAAQETTIAAKILAQVLTMHVDAGDTVRAGQLLVELDDRDLKARLKQAQRALEAAAAQLERARADYDRAKQLHTSGNISTSELDAARAAFETTRAEHQRARRTIDEAEVRLSYARLTAPTGGRVIDRLVQPGDTVSPGQPLLNIYDPQALRLEVPVRETLATQLSTGDTLKIHIDALDRQVTGTIDDIVPQAQTGSRAFFVKVVLPPQDNLYAGMFGRLMLPTATRTHYLVPPAAVDRIGQLTFVRVLTKDRHLQRRMVTLGSRNDADEQIVLSGLREGETVALRSPR